MNVLKPHCLVLLLMLIASESFAGGPATGSAWQRLADMPGPREQHGFDALNGILYVVCGVSDIGHERTVYAYDIATNTWTTKTPAPIALQSPILRAVNGKLYLIGGYDSSIGLKYNTTFEYDPATDTWTQKASIPTAREDMASAVVDGKIYVFGGDFHPGHHITSAVEVYDPATDTWEIKSNMPNPRALGDFGCAYHDKVYLVSGTDTIRDYPCLFPSTRVYEYDPSDDTWTRKADIPTGRCYKEVEEVNGLLYVISGATRSTQKSTRKTEVYSISNNSWVVGPNAPYAARGAGLTKHDGKIYLSGGFSYDRYLRNLYRFDPDAANIELAGPKTPAKSKKPAEPDISLHEAAAMGDINRARAHISRGADVNARDDIDRVPLHWAAEAGHEDVVRLLITKGADINLRDRVGCTALHWAARQTNRDILEFLIAKGAYIDARDKQGRTPLHEAVSAGHRNITALIVIKGANVNAKSGYGRRPLHLACKPDIAGLLIAHGARVDVRDRKGRTLLHWAAVAGRRDLAELLIAKGANLNVTDSQGRTPLSWANIRGHKEIVELLRKHGAKE